ncbi:hypothetical protein [Ralstonia pseudosolanacearum]|uniref:hypothetical protein n=1 Tax=Ralstonia pseudosolanacearum TaxID=1310165 RepID=UPI00399D6C10
MASVKPSQRVDRLVAKSSVWSRAVDGGLFESLRHGVLLGIGVVNHDKDMNALCGTQAKRCLQLYAGPPPSQSAPRGIKRLGRVARRSLS